jgi:hypothetical protein
MFRRDQHHVGSRAAAARSTNKRAHRAAIERCVQQGHQEAIAQDRGATAVVSHILKLHVTTVLPDKYMAMVGTAVHTSRVVPHKEWPVGPSGIISIEEVDDLGRSLFVYRLRPLQRQWTLVGTHLVLLRAVGATRSWAAQRRPLGGLVFFGDVAETSMCSTRPTAKSCGPGTQRRDDGGVILHRERRADGAVAVWPVQVAQHRLRC